MRLIPDYSYPEQIALVNQRTLRKLVGILGMALPLLVYIFLWFDTGYTRPMESISHYYFTRSCGIFVIVVSLLAIFLLVYKGKKPVDFWFSTVAGIAALLLLLFPTSNINNEPDCLACSVTRLKEPSFRPTFHLLAAALFLLTLALMSLFLFTKSKGGKTKAKRKRNFVYYLCGSLMLAALLVILLGIEFDVFGKAYFANKWTFWMETLAVEAFGFAWFVKGEAILKDEDDDRHLWADRACELCTLSGEWIRRFQR